MEMEAGAALLRGSSDSVSSLSTCNSAFRPGPSCGSAATLRVPKVSCKYNPSVGCAVTHKHPVCLPSHEVLIKQSALVNQIRDESCQSTHLPENWIEDCVSDIVKHIHEAPFLQMLFNHENTSTVTMSQLQRVPVTPTLSANKKWRTMKRHVDNASPDAVILVHNLGPSNVEGLVMQEETTQPTTNRDPQNDMADRARFWGIVVVGKTIAECACYILETTHVTSSVGICTHFCLRKAQTFGPSWIDQIRNSWLL